MQIYIHSYVFPVGDIVSGEAYNPSRLVLRAVPTGPEAVCEFIPSWPGAINVFRTFTCAGQLKFLDYTGLTGEGYWKYGGSSFTNYDVYLHPNIKNLNVLPNDDVLRPPGTLNYNNRYRALKETDSKAGAVWDPNVSTAGDPCQVSPTYYEIIGAGYSGFSIFAPGGGLGNTTPLPIELISFSANCAENGNVSVNWATASEKDVAYFEIQKSYDGSQYSTIHKLDIYANSSIRKDYQFTDNNAGSGVIYYRLKETDLYGLVTYHQVASAECAQSRTALNVFFHEGEGIVSTLNTLIPGDVAYQITDASGRLMLAKTYTLAEGTHRLQITDATLLPKGIYMVTVMNKGELQTFKVFVK